MPPYFAPKPPLLQKENYEMDSLFRAVLLFLLSITAFASVWLLLNGRPFLEKVCRPWRLLVLAWEASFLAMGWATIAPFNADRVVGLALAVQCSVYLFVAWRSYVGRTIGFGIPSKAARAILVCGSCFPLIGFGAGLALLLRWRLLH